MTRLFFDTEFIDDGKTIDLISIGIVSQNGRTYYAESEECDLSRACPWVKANVIPHLVGPRKPRAVIAREIVEFAGPAPEFWAWFGAYDWVLMCQLYGRMIDLPKHWPMFVRDLKQVAPMLVQTDATHNALEDAMWLREAWFAMLNIGRVAA